jgi:hypothetical protein
MNFDDIDLFQGTVKIVSLHDFLNRVCQKLLATLVFMELFLGWFILSHLIIEIDLFSNYKEEFFFYF